MGAKKKKRPNSGMFASGSEWMGNRHGQPSTDPSGPRFRERRSVFNSVSTQLEGMPPGATLRPYDDVPETEEPKILPTNSQNWLVDEDKLFQATNHAMQSHGGLKSRRGHIPVLQKHHQKKIGLGVQVSFKCGFKNCKFLSKTYDLFVTA